ncbi:DUF1007 family protein [Starkeya sp. ORNL1]|uniref:DUF1007 family protein n=1 Tax=Starkeya sp. ORNL1 TaxID=2709380 RepID=UPI001472C8CF|nr:DUF1007 family protein [Starkeya sp. ORNL1]
MLNRVATLACALTLSAGPALAHPHVWVDVRSQLEYGPDGALTGVRHVWTFDEGFSAFALQGLTEGEGGKPSDTVLKELAQTNIDSMKEFDYFTFAQRGKEKLAFATPRDYGLTYDGTALTLHFILPLAKPIASAGTTTLDVYDPTYFVAFALADENPVKLEAAPKGCTLGLHRPDPAVGGSTQTLSESFFNALTTSSQFGSQFANRATVTCP